MSPMTTNNSKVSCYYEQVKGQGDPKDIIALCRHSWESKGWTFDVLGRADAERHPRFKEYFTRVSAWPSVNPPGYDLSCWLRWLAFSMAGGGVHIDYDTINRSLDAKLTGGPGGDILIGEWTRVPCMVMATAQGAADIVDEIMKPLSYPTDDHFSDMHFFQRTSWPHTTVLCRGITHPDWERAPVVHFSTSGCRAYNKMAPNKLTVMQDVLFRQ